MDAAPSRRRPRPGHAGASGIDRASADDGQSKRGGAAGAARDDRAGWVAIDKEGYEIGCWLAARGWTVFVLFYRPPGEGWAAGPDVVLADAQRAMRLIRAGGVWDIGRAGGGDGFEACPERLPRQQSKGCCHLASTGSA